MAALGVALAMARLSAGLLAFAALASFVPAFAWADTGGRLRRGGAGLVKIEERIALFTRAWLACTAGLFVAAYLAGRASGIAFERF